MKTKFFKRIIAALTATIMSVGLCSIQVMAAAKTYDVYLDSMTITSGESVSLVNTKFTASVAYGAKNIIIQGTDDLDTNLSSTITLTDGVTYTLKGKGIINTTFGNIVPHLRTPVAFDVNTAVTLEYYPGKDFGKKDLYDAIYKSAEPAMSMDKVAVMYDATGEGGWVDFTKQGSNRAFGTQSVEKVCLVSSCYNSAKDSEWKEPITNGVSEVCEVTLVDPRTPTYIDLTKETPEIEIGLNYAEELKTNFVKVKDKSGNPVNVGDVSLVINGGNEITVNGVYSVTATYSDPDNAYKPSTKDFNIKVYSNEPTYKATLSKTGEGSVNIEIGGESTEFDSEKMVYFTEGTSNGFKVTTVPQNGDYTASIVAKNGEKTVASVEKANELTIPEGQFANGETCTVEVTFATASAVFKDSIEIHESFKLKNGNEDRPKSEKEIFEKAFDSEKSEPINFTYVDNVSGIKMYRSSGYTGFKDPLLKSNWFGASTPEKVKITYNYNGKSFTSNDISVSFYKWNSDINVPGETITIDEGANGGDYAGIIKSRVSVKDNDERSSNKGTILSGENVTVSNIDNNLFDQDQTVTVSYSGNDDYSKAEDKTVTLHIKSVGFVVNKGTVSGKGDITVPGRVHWSEEAKGFDFKVKPADGNYLTSVTVTKNGVAFKSYTKDSQEVTAVTGEITIHVDDTIALNDEYKVSAEFGEATLTLKDNQQLPGYLRYRKWGLTGTTLSASEKDIFNRIFESSTPDNLTADDIRATGTVSSVKLYYDGGVRGTWYDFDHIVEALGIEVAPDNQSNTTGYQFGVRNSERIRVVYTYNNKKIEKIVNITFYEEETETTVSQGTLTLDEGDDYLEAIKALASVKVKDGNAINGATFDVSNFDATLLNKEQEVTVSYAGESGVYKASSTTLKVTITASENFKASVSDVVDGDSDRTVKIDITNYNDSKVDCDVIFAAYDENGKLCELVSQRSASLNYGSQTLSFVIGKQDYSSYKLFVWDSVSGMKPIFTKEFTSLSK